MISTVNWESLSVPGVVELILSDTLSHGFDMASDPKVGSFLRSLAASKRAANLLELGSGSGLSTAWLLDGMGSDSKLTTVDNDEALLSILKKHLQSDSRLRVICDDADKIIASLAGHKFDIIFADTWAGKYRLLDQTLELLSVGGLYVIDDMLPQDNWPEGHAAKVERLVADLEQRQGYAITKMNWASGIIMLCKTELC